MITKCIFPVAGFGTRFLPITKAVPKELLPIYDRPLIQFSIEEAFECDIRDMTFIVNDYKSAIKDYLKPHPYLEDLIKGTAKENKLIGINNIINSCTLNFVNQSEMKGLGHAILKGFETSKNSNFAVLLPDDLCYNPNASVLEQLLRLHKRYPEHCVVAVEEVPEKNISKYGVISGKFIDVEEKTLIVEDMVEKPSPEEAPSNLAIIGRYILNSSIFEKLKQTKPDTNGEIQITEALSKMAKEGKVLAYKFDGVRLDCGSVESYLEAVKFYEEKFKQL